MKESKKVTYDTFSKFPLHQEVNRHFSVVKPGDSVLDIGSGTGKKLLETSGFMLWLANKNNH